MKMLLHLLDTPGGRRAWGNSSNASFALLMSVLCIPKCTSRGVLGPFVHLFYMNSVDTFRSFSMSNMPWQLHASIASLTGLPLIALDASTLPDSNP